MAVEISSEEELREWLEDKPQEWAQVITLRCALRALPVVAIQRPVPGERVDPLMPLLTFKAFAISFWAFERREKDAVETAQFAAGSIFSKANDAFALQQSYEWKVSETFGEEEKAKWRPHWDRSLAVTAAWKTAAKVASLAANSIVAFGASTAANVIQAAKASVNTSQAITPTLFEAIEADCRFLEEHPTFADLSRARLWLNPPAPACWRKEWDNARKWLSLPGYNFQIWREWYYGRIEGLPHAFADFDNEADGKFYRWIVEQDDNWWSREPAVVNAEITEFVDALRITAPTDEELRQNPRAFTFSLDEEGRSELDEETLPNGLQGDPDERDNHSEILRLIEIALLATAAQTNAKDMEEPTRLLKEAVGEDVEALRPRLFILRAREIIRQVDERESGDSLNPQLSEKQRDAYLPLVEALKMIAEFSPKLAELWHGKLGQTGTPLTREMLDLIAEALRTTGQTTALAQSVIEASNALVAPDAPEDDPARVAASETSRNAFRKMGGTLKKAGEGAKDAENIISLGERLFKIAGIVRDKLPSGEVIARIIASFGGG